MELMGLRLRLKPTSCEFSAVVGQMSYESLCVRAWSRVICSGGYGEKVKVIFNEYLVLKLDQMRWIVSKITNTVFVAKLLPAAFLAHLAEHCIKLVGSRVQFPAGGQGVAIFATHPGWLLKYIILTFENLLHEM